MPADRRPPPRDPPRDTRAALLYGGLATLALLIAALFGHSYLSHGLFTTYEAGSSEEGGRFLVHRTVEHRVQFPNEHRPLSRYVQEWDFDGRGIPRQMPYFRATLEGQVRIPGPHPARLRVRTGNEAQLFVDGQLQPEEGAEEAEQIAPLRPGEHSIRIVWQGRFEERRSERSLRSKLFLEHQTDGRSWEQVPAGWTTPKEAATSELALLWVGFALAWLALCLPLILTLLGEVHLRKRRLGRIALVALLLLGAGFRLFDYQVMPNFQENGDELFATWNGWQLLTDGTTRGWSLWAGTYGGMVRHESLPYWSSHGGGWHIITPYFEHPPLSHVLVGAAAKLGGASHFAHSRLKHTRLVPIGLSLISMLLIFGIGRELDPRRRYGPWLSVLLYGVLPLIAIQNRAIKEEMLLAPMELLSLYLFLRWRRRLRESLAGDGDGGSDWMVIAAAFLAGATCLAKVTGAVLVPAILMLIATTGRWKTLGKAAIAGFGAIGLLFLYGAVTSWEVFLFTTAHQATGRPSHWNIFPRFFADGLVIHNLMFHGPTLFLWLASMTYLGSRGRRLDPAWLIFPTTYLIGMAVSSGNWTFGWYMLPTYPFLCLAAGHFLEELWERPNPLYGLIFVGLLVMYGLNFTESPDYFKRPEVWQSVRTRISVFVALMLGPYFLAASRRSWGDFRALARAVTVAGLLLFIGLSGYFVARYDVLYETHFNFDRDTFFDR